MRGVFLKPPRSPCPERAVLAAIFRQALRDAKRGNEEAVAWLDDVGPASAAALGLDTERAAAWRDVDLQHAAAGG